MIICWDSQSVAGGFSHGIRLFLVASSHHKWIRSTDQPFDWRKLAWLTGAERRGFGPGNTNGHLPQTAAKGHQTIENRSALREAMVRISCCSVCGSSWNVRWCYSWRRKWGSYHTKNGMTWEGTATPQTRLLSRKYWIYKMHFRLVDVGSVYQTLEEIAK